MERSDLAELHYITPLANVRSILERGILSHVRAEGVGHVSVAAQVIQDLRGPKTVPGGRPLHEYVNLYFHARNPMLFLRKDQHAQLCVLRVSTAVLDGHGVIVTDSNASSKYVRFAPAPAGLGLVDQELTYAESWVNPEDDYPQSLRRKSAKCAEVLVPDQVPADHLLGAYVSCEASMQAFHELAVPLGPQMNAHLFFR